MFGYGKQWIDDDDIEAVVRVLKSEWLTQGPMIEAFESALCNKLKTTYATVVSNGTAALHLTALALGWRKDDIIITSPITFLASANCILYAGATPDFVDIDEVSYTIDVNKLEDKIKNYLKKGNRIKAIVAVDYAGYACDWESLRGLADKYQFQLIDDASHSLGAKYKNRINYATKYADVAILSFHPVKHITSGEGGAILTEYKEIDEKVKCLRTHGITKNEKYLERNDGPWYYEMHKLGFNYRITDFQCALGLTQLKKLRVFIERRQQIAEYYNQEFSCNQNCIIPKVPEHIDHVYHLYPLQIKFNETKINKRDLFLELKEKNINCQVHYIPIYKQPYYKKKYDFKENNFPASEEFYQREISIPIYPKLENDDVKYISSTIQELAI